MPRATDLAVVAAALLASPLAHAAAQPSARWMAHCAANLKGERIEPAVVQKYCACMAEVGEAAEMLTWSQTELERSYPPAHRDCQRRARACPRGRSEPDRRDGVFERREYRFA